MHRCRFVYCQSAKAKANTQVITSYHIQTVSFFFFTSLAFRNSHNTHIALATSLVMTKPPPHSRSSLLIETRHWSDACGKLAIHAARSHEQRYVSFLPLWKVCVFTVSSVGKHNHVLVSCKEPKQKVWSVSLSKAVHLSWEGIWQLLLLREKDYL